MYLFYFLKKVICRYLLTLANDAKLGWPAAIFPFLSSSKAFWTAYMILSRRMAARLSTCGEGEIRVLQCTLTNLLCNLRILLHSSILYQTCRRCLTMFWSIPLLCMASFIYQSCGDKVSLSLNNLLGKKRERQHPLWLINNQRKDVVVIII